MHGTMKIVCQSATPLEAVDAGFAKFNSGPHLCVDVPAGYSTISIRTPKGKLVTFSVMEFEPGEGPRCIDIKEHHTDPNCQISNGDQLVPAQNVAIRGCGPLLYRSQKSDKQVSLIVLGID